MSIQDYLILILKSPLFWSALIKLNDSAIIAFLPQFPPAVIQAIDGLILVIALILTGTQIQSARVASKAA